MLRQILASVKQSEMLIKRFTVGYVDVTSRLLLKIPFDSNKSFVNKCLVIPDGKPARTCKHTYILSQVLNPKNENSHLLFIELQEQNSIKAWLLYYFFKVNTQEENDPCLCVSWVNRYGWHEEEAFTFHLRQKIFFKSSRIVMMWHAAVLHHYDLLRHEAFDAHTYWSDCITRTLKTWVCKTKH